MPNDEYRPIVPLLTGNPNFRIFEIEALCFERDIVICRKSDQDLGRLELPEKQVALLEEMSKIPGISDISIVPKNNETKERVYIGKGLAFSWEKINNQLRKVFLKHGLGFLTYDSPTLYEIPRKTIFLNKGMTAIFEVDREIFKNGSATYLQKYWGTKFDNSNKLGEADELVNAAFRIFQAKKVIISSYCLYIEKGIEPDEEGIKKIKDILEELIQAE